MPIFRRPVFCIMKHSHQRVRVLLLGIGILAICVYLATRPCLFVLHEGKVLLSFPVQANTRFSVRFIHSVQKTPVLENLAVNALCNGFMLHSTKYQSFGVGLPFLMSDGQFRQEGDYFIMDHMDREFAQLAFRTGEGTNFTLLYQGAEYPLYRQLDIGGKIDLQIAPYYTRYRSYRGL